MPSRNTTLLLVLKSAYVFLPLNQAFASSEMNKAEAAPRLQNTGCLLDPHPYRKRG